MAGQAILEAEGQLVLDLDGYEGPIDVLLTLARDQKVDLTRISILQLADQYLVMSRGEIIQQGRGENMAAEGVQRLVAI